MNSEIDTLLTQLDAHPESLLFARLADAYMKADKIDQAIQVCEQGLSHHSDYVTGHVIMGKCYSKIGLLDQAKAEYHRALELDHEHPSALFYLGNVYAEERTVDLARNCYKQILTRDPLNESAKKHITDLRQDRLLKTDGLNNGSANGIVGTSQENSIYTTTLAEIYASQGLTQRALEVLHFIRRRHPDNDSVLERLQALEKQLQREEAGGSDGHNS